MLRTPRQNFGSLFASMFTSNGGTDLPEFVDDFFGTLEVTEGHLQDTEVRVDAVCTRHYTKGLLGRLDGPAIVYVDTKKPSEWWYDGVRLTEVEVVKLRTEKEDADTHTIALGDNFYKISGSQLRAVKKLLEIRD